MKDITYCSYGCKQEATTYLKNFDSILELPKFTNQYKKEDIDFSKFKNVWTAEGNRYTSLF